mmetsp:Transcript_111040/g.301355  ORF Transcript_111040/g.301355 Transcript_111040/m.301355 type:complete len:318 (+) Transcript_111040:718-1671(+)
MPLHVLPKVTERLDDVGTPRLILIAVPRFGCAAPGGIPSLAGAVARSLGKLTLQCKEAAAQVTETRLLLPLGHADDMGIGPEADRGVAEEEPEHELRPAQPEHPVQDPHEEEGKATPRHHQSEEPSMPTLGALQLHADEKKYRWRAARGQTTDGLPPDPLVAQPHRAEREEPEGQQGGHGDRLPEVAPQELQKRAMAAAAEAAVHDVRRTRGAPAAVVPGPQGRRASPGRAARQGHGGEVEQEQHEDLHAEVGQAHVTSADGARRDARDDDLDEGQGREPRGQAGEHHRQSVLFAKCGWKARDLQHREKASREEEAE